MSLPHNVTLVCYIGNIMLLGLRGQEVANTLDLLAAHVHVRGWELYLTKLQRPSTLVGHTKVSLQRQRMHLGTPTTKKHLGFFGFWKRYLSRLGVLFWPIYQVIQETAGFEWEQEQEAFHQVQAAVHLDHMIQQT